MLAHPRTKDVLVDGTTRIAKCCNGGWVCQFILGVALFDPVV